MLEQNKGGKHALALIKLQHGPLPGKGIKKPAPQVEPVPLSGKKTLGFIAGYLGYILVPAA